VHAIFILDTMLNTVALSTVTGDATAAGAVAAADATAAAADSLAFILAA
jgi:hypothetical protein